MKNNPKHNFTLLRPSILLFLFIAGLSSFAQQNNCYFAGGQARYFQNDSTSFLFVIERSDHVNTVLTRLRAVFDNENDSIIRHGNSTSIIVKSNSLKCSNLDAVIDTISCSSDDISFVSFAKTIDNQRFWLTNEVFVQTKDTLDFNSLAFGILSKHDGVTVDYSGSNLYRIRCKTEGQVLSIANELHGLDGVLFSTPDFYGDYRLQTDDPYFDTQWALKNTGQSGGVSGVDIKAEEAWSFLQKAIGVLGGNVTVAVVDDGVEDHEDLRDPQGNSRVLPGFTADNDGPGYGLPGELCGHGENCAGIIGASHNTIGIAGIAPNVSIVPIKIYEDLFTCCSYSQMALAIRKAWDDYYAPVLSNSWCGGPENDLLTSAINYVANQGRSGKGCVVCFSSGNRGNVIDFPSTLESVISVGAVNRNGTRLGYSNYGAGLDVVGPSDPIVTTDRMGEMGYVDGNYFETFDGTSAACPHVAGVAALMLSINPDLTRAQVMDIIERNCQKTGGYGYQMVNNDPELTWNTNVGYGLVDAHKSVVQAALYGYDIGIVGKTRINDYCSFGYRLDIPYPNAFNYSWTCSSNLSVLQCQGNKITVMANDEGAAWIEVEVYSEGRFVGTYSKNVVVSELSDNGYVYNSVVELHNNATWDSCYFLKNGLVVNAGVTLTITGSVYCSDITAIKVKPTGKLVIDGGHVSSICESSIWPGIEVWGNSNTDQQEVNGSYQQGYVELKNGATIENARCALRLRNPLVNGTSGGIVHATDAVFLNNALAVEASNYTNHGSGQRELDYNGWFKNCSFTVDDDFPGQAAFHSHASLSNVNGIAFNGCSFTTDRSVDSVDFLCTGIAAYNASFHVTDYCDSHMLPCPSGSLVRSSFSGFHRGVGSVNDGQSTRTFSVKESDFTGNDIGIFALNASTATALANNFNVGGLTDCSFGIYLEGVALCRVEENDFSKAPGTSSVTYGVSVKNSQAANDIYRNQFNGLSYGNIATGRNAIVTEIGGVPSVTTGLTYTCNSNESNIVDFRIADDGDYAGIQPVQGSATVAAGNTFSGSQWHIYNDGDYTLGYYYDALDPDQTPTASKLYRVSATASAGANRCLTHYGDSPVKQSPEGIDSLSVRWAEARTAFENLRQLYEAQAGNETADMEPDVVGRILAEMTEKAHEATEAAGDILRSLANEPGSDPDEMRRWLAALECPDADRIAVASLLEQGDIDEALAQAQSMADKYDPKRLDPKEHADYMRLVSLYADLRLSGRSAFDLTGEESTLVEDMVAEGTGHARLLAQALLEGTGRGQGLTLCPADIIEENRNCDYIDEKHQEVEDMVFGKDVTVSPNPGNTQVEVKAPVEHALIRFYDLHGKLMLERPFSRNTTVGTYSWPQGLYLWEIWSDTRKEAFGKWVKQ